MPTIRIDGDARGAIDAAIKAEKSIAKIGKQAGKTTGKLDKMTRAARTIREANNPQLRYNRLLKNAARLVIKNKLSLDQATQAAVRYGKSLERANRARLGGAAGGRGGAGGFGGGGFGGGGFMGGIGGRLTGGLGGYLTVAGLFSLIRNEISKREEFQDARTGAQKNVALSEQKLAQNVASFNAADREDAFKAAARLARDEGFGVPVMEVALAKTISASGGVKTGIELLKEATNISRDPEGFSEIAGALADIKFNATEIKTAADAAGALAGTAAQSRGVSPSQVGTGLAPASGVYVPSRGSSIGVGAGFLNVFSRGASDEQLRLSRTATVQLPDIMQGYFDEPSVRSLFKPSDIDGIDKQHNILISGRYKFLNEEFLKLLRTNFRAIPRQAGVRYFSLDPAINSELRQVMADTIANVNTEVARAQIREDMTRGANFSRSIITSKRSGRLDAAYENFLLTTDARLTSDEGRQIVNLSAIAQRKTFTEAGIEKALFNITNLRPEDAITYIDRIVESGRKIRAANRTKVRPGPYGFGSTRTEIPGTATPTIPEERKAEEGLLDMRLAIVKGINETKEFEVIQKEQAAEAKDIREKQLDETKETNRLLGISVAEREAEIENARQVERALTGYRFPAKAE